MGNDIERMSDAELALAVETTNVFELAVILMYLSMLAKVRRPSSTPSSSTIKFLFVDLNGLDRLATLPEETLQKVRGLELRFDIRKSSTQRLQPTLKNVKLYCTPIVNLFTHDAMPTRLDGKQDEYLLMPSRLALEHCGVFSVDKVTGWKVAGSG